MATGFLCPGTTSVITKSPVCGDDDRCDDMIFDWPMKKKKGKKKEYENLNG